MQILSIQLKNIKSHRDTVLNFAPGINVLSGPNGVGKSTVFEAIGYALFGVDAQSFVGKVERFVSIGAKRGEIGVTFSVAEENYQVSRTVGTPSKWLLAKEVGGDFEVEEHKDSKETEARLKELLGLDNGRSLAEQFELVIGPFQNEFLGPFVEKRPMARRNKFDEILGIDSWRKTFSETNALQKAIKNRVEVLEGAIGPLKDQLALLPEKRVAHKTARQDHQTTAKELTDKQQKLQQLVEQLKALDDREQGLRQVAVEVDKLAERIDNGHEKITRQKTLIVEAEKSRQVVADTAAGKQAYEQAEQRLAGLREQQKQQRRLEQEQAALTNQSSAVTAGIETETKGIALAREELVAEQAALKQKGETLIVAEAVQQLAEQLPLLREGIKQRRDQLGRLDGRRSGLEEGRDKLGEGVCPFFQEHCLNITENPSADVFSVKLDALAGERSRLQEELLDLERQEAEAVKAHEQIQAFMVQRKAVEEQVGQLAARGNELDRRESALRTSQRELEALRQRLTAKQQELAAFASLAAEIETAEADVKLHQQARDLYVAHQGQAAKLEGLQVELAKFEAFLKQLQGELATKQEEQKTLAAHYDAQQHQALRDEKDGLGRDVGSLEMKLNGLNRDMTRLAAEIDALKAIEEEIVAKQTQIKAYGEKEELIKFLRNRVFNKVSASLSERFREEISQRANQIYRIIAEVDEELAWGDNYQIVLRDMVEGELRERADDQLSGGQTMSAVVALRLAMLQTIGARIAFFDEPTSNLDAARRENLAHAFRAIDVGKEEASEHWYDQLFLISHDVAFTEVTDQMIDLDRID
nr:SMC family ATPase [uncultured Desulfuromonas sp.]